MRTLLSILFCIFGFSAFGQHTVNGTIRNAATKEVIPYVNIGIVHKNKGTVSDAYGTFSFEIPAALLGDTIRVSSIGYASKVFVARDFIATLSENRSIELSEKVMELDEVVVSGKKRKEKVLGNKTKSGMLRGGFRNAELGNELGVKIKIKKKSYVHHEVSCEPDFEHRRKNEV